MGYLGLKQSARLALTPGISKVIDEIAFRTNILALKRGGVSGPRR
jgi:hypothetical protein